MKTVCELDKCTGCMACVEVCSKDAITIKDDLTTYNAVINNEKCIECNACHRICHVNNPIKFYEPKQWYQGWSKNNRVRNNGSSGGVAMSIAENFIKNGGYVSSCLFENGEFKFKLVNKIDELKLFAGSKYVKSNPIGIYKQIRKLLSNKEKILFIGLPCQVAALKNFVGNKYKENLYTIDLICHGTPSSQLLEQFLNQYHLSLKKSDNISFRNKENFQVYQIYNNNNNSVITEGVIDKYMIAFLNALIYTENCYECPYAQKGRVSDITLGDSWGTEIKDEWIRGISLILSQTDKGNKLIKDSDLQLEDVDLDNAIKHNHQLSHPSIRPDSRDTFFIHLSNDMSFNKCVSKALPKQSIKQYIKLILIKLNIYSYIKMNWLIGNK